MKMRINLFAKLLVKLVKCLTIITIINFKVSKTLADNLSEDGHPSYSTKWNLESHLRRKNRQIGYCQSLCGYGHDTEADGLDTTISHYKHRKHTKEYYALVDAVTGSYDETPLGNIFEATDLRSGYNGERSLKSFAALVDTYCELLNSEETRISFDECLQIEQSYYNMQQSIECTFYCKNEVFYNDILPKSQSQVSLERRKFEECLDDFHGPHEVFDFKNSSFSVPQVVEIFRKSGFVTITNVFPSQMMDDINKIMNDWDDSKQWNELQYKDFYSAYTDQLRDYENRLEVVLPKVQPFTAMLDYLHNTTILKIINDYSTDLSKNHSVDVDFITTIMSRPGAETQGTHGDHSLAEGMIKIAVAIHDVTEKLGPTSFCPCTHRGGITHPIYNKDCLTRYHPDFLPKGSVVLYDQSVKHRGSANNGDIRRYLLDLSYSIDPTFNRYESTWPQLAQEHIRQYRLMKNL